MVSSSSNNFHPILGTVVQIKGQKTYDNLIVYSINGEFLTLLCECYSDRTYEQFLKMEVSDRATYNMGEIVVHKSHIARYMGWIELT